MRERAVLLPMTSSNLAILVGGGPAPGINSVIGAATIRAVLSNVEPLGIHDGFRWLMEGDTSHVEPLTIAETSRIHFRGGSVIGVSRANPSKDPELLARCAESLERLGVGMLITIGGYYTCWSAAQLARMMAGRLRVVHVPKTIDNDLDLPEEVSTFGHQTARHIGVEIVKNLMVDARTTSRWYLVVARGRRAGHLALGIGKSAGATLTLIPEEFTQPIRLEAVVDTLAGAIIKRLAEGRPDGVAVLAPGLGWNDGSPTDAAASAGWEPSGALTTTEVDFGNLVKRALTRRLADLHVKTTIVAKNIGYEVRCADPIPFDMEYARDLGHCAAECVIGGGSGVVITMQRGRFVPLPFEEIVDPVNGRMRLRAVDIASDRYQIARSYMIRLKPGDLADGPDLERLARTVNLSPEAFRAAFQHTLDSLKPC
jgi:ATP-dependent phosphofructokinase / diphosphate-dependent phosphofructokinase